MPVPRAVDGLEERVARLERDVAQLRAALGDEPAEQEQASEEVQEASEEEQASYTRPAAEQSSFVPSNQGAEHIEGEPAASAEQEEEGARETLEWT